MGIVAGTRAHFVIVPQLFAKDLCVFDRRPRQDIVFGEEGGERTSHFRSHFTNVISCRVEDDYIVWLYNTLHVQPPKIEREDNKPGASEIQEYDCDASELTVTYTTKP